eukprot:EG_transcript_4699
MAPARCGAWLLPLFWWLACLVTPGSALTRVLSKNCTQTPGVDPACTITGSTILTVFGAAGTFSASKADNAVALTRRTGTNSGTSEPVCNTQCGVCTTTTNGTFITCALLFLNGVDSGNFTLNALRLGTSVGNMSVLMGPANPAVISGVDCGQGSDKRPGNCTNGGRITIWGSNFDVGYPAQNVVSFFANSYGVPISQAFPYCSEVYYVEDRFLFCNITNPPGVFGEFAVMVTKEGVSSVYESLVQVTVTVSPLTKTSTPTLTGTPTLTSTASGTATYTGLRTFSDTPTESATESATRTPTGSATATPTATATHTGSATTTRSTTLTRSATDTATATSTDTASATETASATPSPTTSATGTMTGTGTNPVTLSPTPTPTRTGTPTSSASATPTSTGTRSSSPTATLTSSLSPTETDTGSATPTRTSTLTFIPTSTPTASATPTRTASPTGSTTATPTETSTGTPVPPWSEWLRFTFKVDPDLWTYGMLLKFRTAVAVAAQISDVLSYQNVEVEGTRFAEDSDGHRMLGYSVIQWRLVNVTYGIKGTSAEIVALSMFQRLAAVDAIMNRTGLPYVPGSLSRLPVPRVPLCRECYANTDVYADVPGLAAPMKCAYTMDAATLLASAWPSDISTMGCANLLSYTFNIVEV